MLKPVAVAAANAVLTYTLGRSLYVPLTSRCNTLTLPQTRGPGFDLPSDVVSALEAVRALEDSGDDGASAAVAVAQPRPTALPPPRRSLSVPALPQTICVGGVPLSAESIAREVLLRLNHGDSDDTTTARYGSLVFAGEGEPTLRMSALLSVVRAVVAASPSPMLVPPVVRVITNGLGDSVPRNRGGEDGGRSRRLCAARMRGAGVTAVSVALMTGCEVQYNDLMRPLLPSAGSGIGAEARSAHDFVCSFRR